VLDELSADDAGFVLELLNTPGFLRFIGDRGVRDHTGAEAYIANGPLASYARHGFGLWRVRLAATGEAIGICGLLKRDSLPDPDIGYAYLPRHEGRGYAREAARACLAHGLVTRALPRVLAIVNHDNERSIRLLEGLGMRHERTLDPEPDVPRTELYAISREDHESL